MISCLEEQKFDYKNRNHHLIVLGDIFDRGTKSKEVLEYLYMLKLKNKASLVLGNHDNFLIEFLNGNYSRAIFNMVHNGMLKTLESLVGRTLTVDENWDEISYEIKNKYIYLYNFLSTMLSYIEINDYIFVHGGVPYNNGEWKNNSVRDFIWSRESQLERIPNRIVVSGHERVSTIRYPGKDQKQLFVTNPDAFSILRFEGKILIDAYVEISNKINVLILELEDGK